MKKIGFLSLLILAHSMLYSQWEWQSPVPTGNPLFDLFFMDNDHGWIVGANGTVLVTINGGDLWDIIPTGTDKDLQEVVFWNTQAGLVVCNDGTLLKTLNGGEYWYDIPTGYDHVYGLEYQSSQIWLLADQGKILHSSNFGFTWNLVYDNPDIQLNAVSFADESLGWVTGYDYSVTPVAGIILKTYDGGSTWLADTLESIYGGDVIFFNEETGFLSASWGYVYKTNDGGNTWVQIHQDGDVSTEMFFLDEDHGWLHCTGEGGPGDKHDFCTIDGGTTWTELLWFPGILNPSGPRFFTSPEKGFILANGASSYSFPVLFRTDDGGYSWSEVPLVESSFETLGGYPESITSLVMTDAAAGYAVSKFSSTKIYQTNDAGANWQFLDYLPLKYPEDMCFVNRQYGWIVGWKDTYNNQWPPQRTDSAIVLRTNDSGQSWQNVSPGLDHQIYSVFFTDQLNGLISGNGGCVLKSQDGGESWSLLESNTEVNLNDIIFIDDEQGWICGDSGTVLHTQNGGLEWDLQQTNTASNLNAIDFFDGMNGCAAGNGGMIIFTHDGGLTWNTGHLDSNLALYDIGMENTQSAIAAGRRGDEGIYLTSHDGGETWQKPYQPCHNQLACVSIPEPGQVWIAGSKSSILHHEGPLPVTVDKFIIQNSKFKINVYPNPVTNNATIQYSLDESTIVKLSIFNNLGQMVMQLDEGMNPAGMHEVLIDLSGMTSGVYFLRASGLENGKWIIDKVKIVKQ